MTQEKKRVLVIKSDGNADTEARLLNAEDTLAMKYQFFAASSVREALRLHTQDPFSFFVIGLQGIIINDLLNTIPTEQIILRIPEGSSSIDYYIQQGIRYVDSSLPAVNLLQALQRSYRE